VEHRPEEAATGLIALPAVTVALGLVAQRYRRGPIQLTGPLGFAVNAAVIAALVLNDYTGPEGALIFYATTMLIAAWRGQAGCEGTAVSNWILGRKDQIGCPTFTPVDELEDLRSRQASRRGTRVVA
jgi:hypothetical protein